MRRIRGDQPQRRIADPDHANDQEQVYTGPGMGVDAELEGPAERAMTASAGGRRPTTDDPVGWRLGQECRTRSKNRMYSWTIAERVNFEAA